MITSDKRQFYDDLPKSSGVDWWTRFRLKFVKPIYACDFAGNKATFVTGKVLDGQIYIMGMKERPLEPPILKPRSGVLTKQELDAVIGEQWSKMEDEE